MTLPSLSDFTWRQFAGAFTAVAVFGFAVGVVAGALVGAAFL